MQKDGGANIAMASRFSLAAYIICLFDPLLSLVYFRQFLHFTYIYVALVTQGLLCYNIATLVMFTSFRGGSRGEARGARTTTPPPHPPIWIRHCRCQCTLNVLLSSQLKSIKTIYHYINNASMVWWPAQRER